MSATKEQAKYKIHQELGGIEMVEANFHRHNFYKNQQQAHNVF